MLRVFKGVLIAAVLLVPISVFADTLTSNRKSELTNLVRQDCGSCHGMTMKGSLGKPLLPQALEDFDTEELKTIILDGVAGTTMPPWRGLISPQEAEWIALNLKQGLKQ